MEKQLTDNEIKEAIDILNKIEVSEDDFDALIYCDKHNCVHLIKSEITKGQCFEKFKKALKKCIQIQGKHIK